MSQTFRKLYQKKEKSQYKSCLGLGPLPRQCRKASGKPCWPIFFKSFFINLKNRTRLTILSSFTKLAGRLAGFLLAFLPLKRAGWWVGIDKNKGLWLS
jgi:hypothetical protein